MWSRNGLGLKLGSIELCLYARIYGFSRKGAGIYYETQEAAARAFEVSARQIQRCIKSLSEAGLIIEVGRYKLGNSRDARRWRVSQEAIESAISAYDEISPRSPDKMSHVASPDTMSHGQSPTCRTPSPDILSCDPKPHTTVSHPDRGRRTNIQQSSMKRTPAAPDAFEQLDSEARAACRALMARSLNSRACPDDVAEAYAKALEKGYTPEQIARGYDLYAARYRRDNPDTARFAMRLDNYLTRGDGLAFDVPKPAKRKRLRTDSSRSADKGKVALADELREAFPEYNDMTSQRTGLYAQLAKANILEDRERVRMLEMQIEEIAKKIEAFEATYLAISELGMEK